MKHNARWRPAKDYLSNLFGLEGKVAAVIGAAGFLCSEMARALAKAGVKVAVLDKDAVGIKAVAEEIRSNGGDAFAFILDVTNKGDHENALARILEKYGDLHRGRYILWNG